MYKLKALCLEELSDHGRVSLLLLRRAGALVPPVKLDLDLDEVLAPGDLLVDPLLAALPEVLLPPELGEHLVLEHVGHLLTARRLAARTGAGIFGDFPHLGTLSNALKLAVRLRVETAELYRGPAFHVFLKYFLVTREDIKILFRPLEIFLVCVAFGRQGGWRLGECGVICGSEIHSMFQKS